MALYGNWKVQAEKVEQEELETQQKNQEKVDEYQKSLHKQVEEIHQKKKDDYVVFQNKSGMTMLLMHFEKKKLVLKCLRKYNTTN